MRSAARAGASDRIVSRAMSEHAVASDELPIGLGVIMPCCSAAEPIGEQLDALAEQDGI